MTIVNIQDNPVVPVVGTLDSDAVIIESQQDTTSIVNYQIENIRTQDIITVNSRMNENAGGDIVSVNARTLKIILEFRTKYRVRTKTQFGSFGAWVNFTTRAKRYQSPDAITQLADDTDSTAQTQGNKLVGSSTLHPQGGSRTIRVTNNGKASVNIHQTLSATKRGASVTNSDTVYSDGQLQNVGNGVATPVYIHTRLTNTTRGATVVNVPRNKNHRIVFTNRGATVNTIG